MLPPLFSWRFRIDIKILILVGLYFLIGSGGDSNLQPAATVLGLFYPLCGLLVEWHWDMWEESFGRTKRSKFDGWA